MTPTPTAHHGYPEAIMPIHSNAMTDMEEELADLDSLATELAKRGLLAELRTPGDKLPYLDVTNPGISVLTERVYAQADAYWFGWAEKIGDCDDVIQVADKLAHVLGSGIGDTAKGM
jgi:hypothetical protein